MQYFDIIFESPKYSAILGVSDSRMGGGRPQSGYDGSRSYLKDKPVKLGKYDTM